MFDVKTQHNTHKLQDNIHGLYMLLDLYMYDKHDENHLMN